WGGVQKQYQVHVDPERLLKYDVTFAQVVQALHDNNLNVGGGKLDHAGEMLLVHGTGRTGTVEQLRNVPVTAREGAPVRGGGVAGWAGGGGPAGGVRWGGAPNPPTPRVKSSSASASSSSTRTATRSRRAWKRSSTMRDRRCRRPSGSSRSTPGPGWWTRSSPPCAATCSRAACWSSPSSSSSWATCVRAPWWPWRSRCRCCSPSAACSASASPPASSVSAPST